LPDPARAPLPRLHAVTDERVAASPATADAARALAREAGPLLALHARGHELSGRAHYALAAMLGAAGPLFVNDRLDVALACQAAGVQLSPPRWSVADARCIRATWWIGAAVHSVAEARAAAQGGADYLLVGPVFRSASHADHPPLDPQALRAVVALGLPVVAIGGVTPERVAQLRRAGVYGLAAIRALWDAPDPAAAARAFVGALTDG